MGNIPEKPDAITSQVGETTLSGPNALDLRPDLAFPTLTEEMVHLLRAYGREETVLNNTTLYSQGDSEVDLFVVLDGGVDVYLPTQNGDPTIYGHYGKFGFAGDGVVSPLFGPHRAGWC